MKFENVSIKSLAYVDAPHVITSASLEDILAPVFERLGLRPHIIQELTGIESRRFFGVDEQPQFPKFWMPSCSRFVPRLPPASAWSEIYIKGPSA